MPEPVYAVERILYASDGYDGEVEVYVTEMLFATRKAAEAYLAIPEEEIQVEPGAHNSWTNHWVDADGLRVWKEVAGFWASSRGYRAFGKTKHEAIQRLREQPWNTYRIREWEVVR